MARHERATGGQDVWVLASKPFGGEAHDILSSAGIAVYGATTTTATTTKATTTARTPCPHAGAARPGRQTRVWIGSENWSGNARGTDELTIRVNGFGMHQTYVKHFGRAADLTAPWKSCPRVMVICTP